MKSIFGRPEQAHIRAEMLSAFLDNQVSPAERVRVESHLRTCAACRGELESLRRTAALLHALPRVAVPHAFTLSEASIGVRRPEPKSVWLGGLARGLGAVTAIALVAVVAVTMLRQPAATPSGSVARSAPTAAPAAKEVEVVAPAEQPAAPAAAAPAPVPTEEQPSIMAAAATEAGEQTTAEAAANMPAADASAEVAVAAAPGMGQPQATEALPQMSQPAARGMAPTATPEAAMIARAPSEPESTTAPSAKAFGMGGASAEPVLRPELLTPEPMPAIVPPADSLLTSARLVYADLEALWAVDGLNGVRQLATGETLNTPLLSSDGTYVVYRTQRQGTMELWGVAWRGGAPKLLLNESELSREGLDALHTERRLQDVRWVPGRLALALNIVQAPSPTAPDAQAVVELWELDVTTGALRYLTPLGRAYRPYYSPDGAQFALLEYGTETDPRGNLYLVSADGRNRRLALSFSGIPASLSYDTQVAWLPDSSALWAAVPISDSLAAGRLYGTALYKVDVTGKAQEMGSIDASQVAWSPDGRRLAYMRITPGSMEDGELYLADADGANERRYAAVKNGVFMTWSPDSVHFLYQDDYQTYLGAVDQAPQRLGTSVSFVDPRWVSDTQFVSRHDTGTGWLLTVRGINGAAQGLLPLPRDAMLDAARP